MDKQALRAEIRAKKRAMTPAQIEAASDRLAELLFAHPAYRAAKSLYGAYNIPEPVADTPVADDETALVLMPGLAFDPDGHRCGYGGGFYDKYLAAHRQHVTLALCYDFQMFAHLDVDDYDIPVQYVLSAPAGEDAG